MTEELFVKIDSHAHITSDELIDDVDNIIIRAKKKHVEKIINICTCEKTLKRGLALEEKYPGYVFNTAATTPHDVQDDGEAFFPVVRKAALDGKLVAIGETGLDYYYEHSPRDLQKEFLNRYFDLAEELSLNVVIHCRGDEAFADLFDIAKKQTKLPRCLLHCFTGNEKQRDMGLELGWMISISGIVTFKRSDELRDVVKGIPLESLLIETDSPYLAPQTKRGQTNEPSYVSEIAEQIASVKEVSVKDVCAQSVKNTWDFFQLSRKLERQSSKD